MSEAVQASLARLVEAGVPVGLGRFTGWAAERGYPFLPAPPAVVAAYVTAAAAAAAAERRVRVRPGDVDPVGVRRSTSSTPPPGLEPPGRSELVRRALSGIRRIRATPPARRAPLLLDDIRGLVDWLALVAGGWPAGVAARRDAALLLMGFAGAFRRSELVAPDPGRRDPAPHRRPARPAPRQQDRPGGPRSGGGAAVRAGPGHLPALRLRPVAGTAARRRHRPRRAAAGGDAGAAPAGRPRRRIPCRRRTATRRRRGRGPVARVPHHPAARTRPTRPGRCSRRCTAPASSGDRPMSGRRGVRDDPPPRRTGRLHHQPRSTSSAGTRCGPGSSPRPSGRAPTRTRSCGRPATAPTPSWRPTPGNTPRWSANAVTRIGL